MLYNTLYGIIRYYTAQSAKNPITQIHTDALPISMKEHMGRSVERARGSLFQHVFENALQTVAPLLDAFSKTLYKQVRRRTSPLLCEPQYYLLSYTFLQLSWLASEIQPSATGLCSLPLRDQINGRGSNTTQLAACDLASYINYDL